MWLPEAGKPDWNWFLPFLCAVCMRWSVNRLWVVCGRDYHCTNVSSLLHSASGLCNCMNVLVLVLRFSERLSHGSGTAWFVNHRNSFLQQPGDTIRLCTETIFHLTIRKIGGIAEVVEIDRHKFWWLVTSLCHKSQKVSTQLCHIFVLRNYSLSLPVCLFLGGEIPLREYSAENIIKYSPSLTWSV